MLDVKKLNLMISNENVFKKVLENSELLKSRVEKFKNKKIWGSVSTNFGATMGCYINRKYQIYGETGSHWENQGCYSTYDEALEEFENKHQERENYMSQNGYHVSSSGLTPTNYIIREYIVNYFRKEMIYILEDQKNIVEIYSKKRYKKIKELVDLKVGELKTGSWCWYIDDEIALQFEKNNYFLYKRCSYVKTSLNSNSFAQYNSIEDLLNFLVENTEICMKN